MDNLWDIVVCITTHSYWVDPDLKEIAIAIPLFTFDVMEGIDYSLFYVIR